jgi:transcriptional regulator with XRE-family HTH domain
MTKQDAIQIFKTQAAIALALGITRSAVSQWPEELDQRTADEITGAALRLGILKPKVAA